MNVFRVPTEAELKSASRVSTQLVGAVKTSGEHRARLVVRGDRQPASSFQDTFSPVARIEHIRTVIAFAHALGLRHLIRDVAGAYLLSKPDAELLCEKPPAFDELLRRSSKIDERTKDALTGSKLLFLDRALYGMRQAGRCWFHTLSPAIKAMGFRRTGVDACIFTRPTDGVVLVVYVDDAILYARTYTSAAAAASEIGKKFPFRQPTPARTDPTDGSSTETFLGVDLSSPVQDNNNSNRPSPIRLLQRANVESLVDALGTAFDKQCRPRLPIAAGVTALSIAERAGERPADDTMRKITSSIDAPPSKRARVSTAGDSTASASPSSLPSGTPTAADNNDCVDSDSGGRSAPTAPGSKPVQFNYASVLGVLSWLQSRSRPDLSYAVAVLSQRASAPKPSDFELLQKLAIFVITTPDRCLTVRRSAFVSPLNVTAYTDASHEPGGPMLGHAVFLGGNLVAWGSKRATVKCTAVGQAELLAAFAGGEVAARVRRLVAELIEGTSPQQASTTHSHSLPPPPASVFIDNRTAEVWARDGIIRDPKSHHLFMYAERLHQMIEERQLLLHHVSTTENVADALTKSLPRPAFERHSDTLLTGLQRNPLRNSTDDPSRPPSTSNVDSTPSDRE